MVDIGLSCPSCRVQLTLPSAYLGQVVTGPCPMCGSTLVFCHGKIENAPTSRGATPVIDVPAVERPAQAARTKLPRSGTVGVHYLDECAVLGAGAESGWGPAARSSHPGQGPGAAPSADGHFRWWWGLGLAGVLALAVGTLWSLSRPAPPPPAPQPAAPGTGGGGPRLIPAGWSEAAVEAWQAFAQATTIEEKLAHVLDAERVAPALRAFDASHPGSDAVWAARPFKPLAGTPDDRRRGQMALASVPSTNDERPIILFLRTELPSDGASAGAVPVRFRLDWETYVQERERLVEGFLDDTTAPRRTFRLAVERVHVFDEATPARRHAEPLGLKLRTPSGLSLPHVAEVRADSPLYARLDTQLRWGLPAYATVELSWDAVSRPLPHVVVSDFVCWHFPGLGGTPEFKAELSPLPPPPNR